MKAADYGDEVLSSLDQLLAAEFSFAKRTTTLKAQHGDTWRVEAARDPRRIDAANLADYMQRRAVAFFAGWCVAMDREERT